eukprot:6162836-Karenia_brevis.AAC.1
MVYIVQFRTELGIVRVKPANLDLLSRDRSRTPPREPRPASMSRTPPRVPQPASMSRPTVEQQMHPKADAVSFATSPSGLDQFAYFCSFRKTQSCGPRQTRFMAECNGLNNKKPHRCH